MSFILIAVYAGQQARILGENYTIEDEEDSRVGTVRINLFFIFYFINAHSNTIWTKNQMFKSK